VGRTSVVGSTAVIALLLLSLVVSPAGSAIIYVKPDGSDSSNGSTWALAKKTVQSGLNAAVSGDEVRVAAGTYVERVTLKSGVGLYGGFAGNEAARDERDWTANVTVLDADRRGSVVTSPVGATFSTRLDGFTVRNGIGTPYGSSTRCGGGVYCADSSPTIANNKITDNAYVACGGGIYCTGSSPVIVSNIITANTHATSGAGIYCRDATATISGNLVSNNGDYGGGVYLQNSSGTISNNFISGNGLGPGIYCAHSSPTITYNIISDNGGGIHCTNSSSPLITGNIIEANDGGYGGGVGCEYSSAPTISSNRIRGNSAFWGGGICCRMDSPAIIANNVILGNASAIGAAVICASGSLATVCNNTMVGNSSTFGGALDTTYLSPVVSNNIIAFNIAGVRGFGEPAFHNNCVYGNRDFDYSPSLTPGEQDILADPRLVAAAYGKVHIQADSPCVDAGYDAAVGDDWSDMDGQPRVRGCHVDIGADESDGTTWAFEPLIVRVSRLGNDLNSGAGWDPAHAKKTIQAAIGAAAGHGGEVWVAAGTYSESISLQPAAHVYGGFAGNEAARSDRDWNTNRSVIEGTGGGSVVTAVDLGYGLSTITGFTIRNGSAALGGGGICCESGSPAIANNRIVENSARYQGGGIYCSMGSPAISGNIIAANSAGSDGGGLYWRDAGLMTNNTVAANRAGERAGGIYCDGSPRLSNNVVALNSSGIFNGASSGSVVLRNNCVYNPEGYDYSGLSPGEGDVPADPLFRDLANGDYHLSADSPCINAGWNDPPGLPEFDMDGQGRICWCVVDIGADEYWPIKVKIDIKPGTCPNHINPKSRGVIPVAILTTSDFDAATVDPMTVELAGARVAVRGKPLYRLEDVDGDGDIDLLLHFETQSLALEPGATQAVLTGRTYGQDCIEGVDSIVIVPAR